jgi:aromatic-L-amino-acid/L-tryptophan decarboxylase
MPRAVGYFGAVPPTPLTLTDHDRALAGRLLATLLDDHTRGLPALPRIVPELDADALAGLLREPFPDKGIGVEQLFTEINETVLPNSTAVAHPRFLAYVLPPPNEIAPYAEAIAAALNQNCNIWQLSPAASVIERSVITWLGDLFGYGDTAGGILTSGGSMATLCALTTALHDRRPDFRQHGLQDPRPALIAYTGTEAHRSVENAAAILGLGLDNLRRIRTDGAYRMRVDLLREAIHADREAGREPFCVIATAGTVTTGAIDPLDDIADLCAKEGLWLHIDGAYGALYVLSDRTRSALLPCARADSIALDPHKLLFAPLEAGGLIVRDSAKLRAAYAFPSPYLPEHDHPVMPNYMDFGPQLSRGFKAFKVWCALRTFGVAAFRDALDQTLDLAQYLAARIEAEPKLRLLAPVPLAAVCFAIDGATDADHAAMITTLADEGTALFGPARLRGRTCIRACIANFRTTRADIDLIVDRLSYLA